MAWKPNGNDKSSFWSLLVILLVSGNKLNVIIHDFNFWGWICLSKWKDLIFLWHFFSICRLGRIMHGSFAKMTPINRHGLCCLALSVFDGPHEEARKIEGATCSIVVVRKRGWEVVHEGFASTNCCQSEMTSHSRLIMKQAKGDIRQWLSLTRLY